MCITPPATWTPTWLRSVRGTNRGRGRTAGRCERRGAWTWSELGQRVRQDDEVAVASWAFGAAWEACRDAGFRHSPGGRVANLLSGWPSASEKKRPALRRA